MSTSTDFHLEDDDLVDDRIDPEPDTTFDEPAGTSDLDAMRHDMDTLVVDEVVLDVTGRPGYAVRFRPDVSGDQVALWRKASRDKRAPDGINPAKFSALVVANCAQQIIRQGAGLVDGEGEPLSFRSRDMLDMFSAATAAEAARRFYGLDGTLDATARAVLLDSGWGEDLQRVDPTPGS